jgi:WD40 repeat protein
MGVVYRARQVSLNRQVAVKVLPGGRFASETFIKRFRREAEAAASLNHPNIVTIHEVGEHEGQLYFSMDLIEGRSLAELLHEEQLTARQAAQLIHTIAQAVAFAHGRRLVHRDLKPSNVLLDKMGVPHITDFGLAKSSDTDADLTLTGQILGSPNYMAPEQADPSLAPTTAASDVYSLGAILYHLLTGRPPFMAETVTRTLRLVAEGGPVPPGLLHPGLSRDLETICLKCLELDPRLRYDSARQVVEELECFLKDEPIRARRVGPVATFARWCRRKPALAAAVGFAAVLLLVISVGSPIAILRIRGERELSEQARRKEIVSRTRAETAEQETRRQLYSALLEQAQGSVRSGEMGQRLRALDAVRRAAAISNSVELRREALAALALPDVSFERELTAGPDFTLKSIDHRFENVATCRGNGPVEIRGLSDWRLRSVLPASTNLPGYLGWWNADSHYLAVKRDHPPAGQTADLEVWEVPSQRRLLFLHNMVKNAMSFHPEQHRLIVAQAGGGVTTWDLDTGRRVARFQLASAPFRLEFAPDGQRFAAVSESGGVFTASIHDAMNGTVLVSHRFADSVLGLNWHPGGHWLAIADDGGIVHLMDSQTGQTRALGSHKAQAATVAFTPSGDYLFSGGWEGELIGWNMHTLQRALTISRHSWTVQFRADERECAVVTQSGIQLYAFVRPNCREFSEDLGPRLRRATFSADSRWLAAAADQYLGVWDLNSGGPGALVKAVDEACPMFVASGKGLVATGTAKRPPRWRIMPPPNGAAPPILEPVDSSSELFASTPAVALTGFAAPDQTEPSVNTGSFEFQWPRTAQGINGISPDGRWLGAFGSFSPFLDIYRSPGMERVTRLRSCAYIGGFAFSPASDQVAVCSTSGVEFWSTDTWTRTRVLTNFTGLLFSPKEETGWLTADFRTAGLYKTDTLKPLLPLPAGILPVAISPDGRRLAVTVNSRFLQLWDLDDVRNQLRQCGLDWVGIDNLHR